MPTKNMSSGEGQCPERSLQHDISTRQKSPTSGKWEAKSEKEGGCPESRDKVIKSVDPNPRVPASQRRASL